jgi:hypothetical protein
VDIASGSDALGSKHARQRKQGAIGPSRGVRNALTTIEKLRNSPEIHEMTVKPQLNSRKCMKMCWVFSNEFQKTASVNFRRLPAKPQLNSRSISQTPAEFQAD